MLTKRQVKIFQERFLAAREEVLNRNQIYKQNKSQKNLKQLRDALLCYKKAANPVIPKVWRWYWKLKQKKLAKTFPRKVLQTMSGGLPSLGKR